MLRSRLMERLSAGLHRKLTLVSAPAGFGKTTLVAKWVSDLRKDDRKKSQAAYQVAWLSLDQDDNDLNRFLTYFITALDRCAQEELFLEKPLSMLQSPQRPPTETLLTALINAIAAVPNEFILVLDDYHLVEAQPVHTALNFLLENSPSQLHLVIATREDPPLQLSRLRARDQLTELRVADLRFSRAEAAEFLNQMMGLTLSTEEITALENRTEGWITGLQLAALSLQGHQDAGRFIQSFTGSHRFVLDYLVEEVLEQQPENVQTFLLKTSILDRLCGSLCDAVLSDPSVSGQETLAYLENANLFLTPLDNERLWYRYHRLFADLLRQRMGQAVPLNEIAEHHIRASQWYQNHGNMPEAFQHAIAAGDVNRAANVAEIAWQGMDESFQMAAWLGLTKQLPEDVIRVRPVLCTQIAWSLTDIGEVEASEARLQDAERYLTESADEMIVVDERQFRTLPARIAFARAYNGQITGPPSATVTYAEEALHLVPEDEPFLRAQIKIVLGSANWSSGKLDAAAQAMREWIESTQKAGNFVFAVASGFGLADILIAQGRLQEAIKTLQQSLQLASDHEEARGVIANHYLVLATLSLEMGDDEAAEAYFEKGIALADQSTLVDTPYRSQLVQARLKEVEEELNTALYLLDEAKRLYVESPIPKTRPVEALKARIYLKQGRLSKAWDWVREQKLSVNDEISYLREFEHITLARVWIAAYRGNQEEELLSDALHLLERLLNAADAENRTGSLIEILIVQALAHEARGDISAALGPLKRALKLAAPEGYLRIFVDEGAPMARLLYQTLSDGMETDHVRRLLGAFPETEPAKTASPESQPDMIEPLSEREIEVLQLIAEGMTNQEVADKLYLSVHTIKVHARNIYAKLGVKNRLQAAEKGKTLGILSQD